MDENDLFIRVEGFARFSSSGGGDTRTSSCKSGRSKEWQPWRPPLQQQPGWPACSRPPHLLQFRDPSPRSRHSVPHLATWDLCTLRSPGMSPPSARALRSPPRSPRCRPRTSRPTRRLAPSLRASPPTSGKAIPGTCSGLSFSTCGCSASSSRSQPVVWRCGHTISGQPTLRTRKCLKRP